jgi:hypothetical protein
MTTVHPDALDVGCESMGQREPGLVLLLRADAYGVVADGHDGVSDPADAADVDWLAVGVGAVAFGCGVAGAEEGQVDNA